MDILREESPVLLRNRDHMIGLACVSKFRIPESAPLFPIEKFLDGAARGVEPLVPEIRLHVMGEKNFGAGECPIDKARGVNEIADQRVEVPAGGQAVQAAPNIGRVEIPQPASGFASD